MLINKPVRVPKNARTKPYSNYLIYHKKGQKLRVKLSDRQVKALEYAWKKFRLYYVSERYSFTKLAKSFILNGTNEALEIGEVKLTSEMLQAWLRNARDRLKPDQKLFLCCDAKGMEDVFIERQMQHSSMTDTFKYVHPFTLYRDGVTGSCHGGGLEERAGQWQVLNGFWMLNPVELYGRRVIS